MKPLGNTLYITKQGAYVSRDGTNVVVSLEKQELLRLPIHTIASIICFGNVLVTPFVLGLCGENRVTVSFLTENGRFLARSTGPQTGNVLLRRAQHRASSDPTQASVAARGFVAGKIANSRAVLQRFLRDHAANEHDAGHANVQRVVDYLAREIARLKHSAPLDEVRGIEGDAARHYFSVFDDLILTNKTDFFFHERSRRPPRDNVNALLSFFYSLLAHETTAACESVGLDPQIGFLHADRPGRPSLALDLMEEFRPWVVDRFVLTLINRGQVSGKNLTKRESGGVEIKDDVRREVIKLWQERKKEEMTHSFLDEKIALGLFPFVQAQLLARWLRGDLDAYPPVFSK